MKISNVSTYGLSSSIVSSGLPKTAHYDPIATGLRRKELDALIYFSPGPYTARMAKLIADKDIKRAIRLGHAAPGSGHDCFLKGIIFNADITASQGWWMQFNRYHFADIVSSQSKEHCGKEMFGVDDPDEVPLKAELTANVVTNYLQLKTIVAQRGSHRREEWKTFCRYVIRELPLFNELCLQDK